MRHDPAPIAAVVPSAGRSRRFGPGVEKPLLPVPGRGAGTGGSGPPPDASRGEAAPAAGSGSSSTFVERVVATLQEAGCEPVVVAVRDMGGPVARVAREAGAMVVPTADQEAGPIGSIRAALDALPADAAGLLLHPVDHPLVGADTVQALIRAFRTAPEDAPPAVVTPVHAGRRGHPVLLHRDLFQELREPGLPEGARSVVHRHRDRDLEVEVDDPGVLADVDDAEDYRRWVDREGLPATEGSGDAATEAPVDAATAAEVVLEETARGRGVAVWLVVRAERADRVDRQNLEDQEDRADQENRVDQEDRADRADRAGRKGAARPGARMLVTERRVRGSLGHPELDRDAERLARERLARHGAPAHETVTLREEPRVEAYLELHRPVPELVVVGAGHIATPLAQIGALLGFRVTVLDDRPDFADHARFPTAHRVERIDMDDPFAPVDVGPGTHVVLVTRGHRYDCDCLRRLMTLPAEAGYVGMIGSRRRVRATWEALLREGIPRERLARVHAPVGLDVGAETPAEIAVAVAAEIVRARRGGSGRPLREVERVLERFFPDDSPDGSPDGSPEPTTAEDDHPPIVTTKFKQKDTDETP